MLYCWICRWKKGLRTKECRWPVEVVKHKERDSLLQPSKNSLAAILIDLHKTHLNFQASELQDNKFAIFEAEVPGKFSSQWLESNTIPLYLNEVYGSIYFKYMKYIHSSIWSMKYRWKWYYKTRPWKTMQLLLSFDLLSLRPHVGWHCEYMSCYCPSIRQQTRIKKPSNSSTTYH